MNDSELDPLRSVLAELAPQGRSVLLSALHAAQRLVGWISEPVAAEVGRGLGVPLADVYGVIDFYEMLNRQPMGRTVLRVCSAPVCALAGTDALAGVLCRHLGTEPGEVSPDGEFTVELLPVWFYAITRERSPSAQSHSGGRSRASGCDLRARC